jgi:hypothetical protein
METETECNADNQGKDHLQEQVVFEILPHEFHLSFYCPIIKSKNSAKLS